MLKVGRPRFDSLAESGQKTSKVGMHSMSIGSGGREGLRPTPWIFIDAVTDK